MTCQLHLLQKDFLPPYEAFLEDVNARTHFDLASSHKLCDNAQWLKKIYTWFNTQISNIQERAQKWKDGKSFQATEFKYTQAESEKIHKHCKWKKIAIIAAQIALASIGITALVAGLGTMGLLYLDALIEFLSPVKPYFPGLVLAMANTIGLGAAGVGLTVAASTRGLWALLKISTSAGTIEERKIRIIKDSDFRDFLQHYIVQPNSDKPHPNEKSLLDKKLHRIYLDYKKIVENARKYVERAKSLA